MLNETIRTSEQQVNAIRLNGSSQGLPVAIGYGRNRASANLIWYGNFRAIANTTSQGGKGGPSMENTTYTYDAGLVFALGFGQITGVITVYREKQSFTPAQLGFSVFTGTTSQTEWTYLTTNNPTEALRYMDIAYVAAGPYGLDSSAGIRNHSFEVAWRLPWGGPNSVLDANPSAIVNDFLTNTTYGALFPSSAMGALTQFSNYCAATGIFFSPLVSEQQEARTFAMQWIEAANAQAFWSEGVLKIVPYGDKSATANGVTFTPVTTVQYALNDTHFVKAPVVDRSTQADAFNAVQVEFLNRATGYNKDVVEARDDVAIQQFGLRQAPIMVAHYICDAAVARIVAQLKLQRYLFVRNTYEFTLPWMFMRLEPMDIVTLTTAFGITLNAVPVRIVSVTKNEDHTLDIVAEDYPGEVGSSGSYTAPGSTPYVPDYNVAPGAANTPVMFEPPLQLTGGTGEVWLATSGGANWGGAHVWVSRDGTNYARVTSVFGKARHGVLSATLATGVDPDVSNTLAVDLTVSQGTLVSVSQADVDGLSTLSFVDGELIAFRDAALTAANRYNLTYLRRGQYQTARTSHASGTRFVRLDQSIAKIPYAASDVGKTLYVKLQSFNTTGGAEETLSGVTAHTYTVQGAQMIAVPGLALLRPWTGTEVEIKWDSLADATSYTVKVYSTADTTLRRTVTGVAGNSFKYTAQDAAADGGPWRALTFEVTAQNRFGASVAASQLAVSNPVPAAPATPTLSPGANSITVSVAVSAEPDVTGIIVWAGSTAGFTVNDAAKVYDGPGTTFTRFGVSSTTYFRVAYYDAWGKTGLNTSAEVSASPGAAGGIPQVTSLPANPAAIGGQEVIYHTVERRLYRWDGDSWEQNLNLRVLANEIYSVDLKAISANIGDLFVGDMVVDADGVIRSQGATALNSGTGLWMGYAASQYQMRLGNPTGARMTWNGTTLTLVDAAIDVNGLFTVSAAGQVTIKSAATGARLEMTNSSIRVYDAGGVLRVELGELL